MTDRAIESSPGRWARFAGGFYLTTIVMGVFAEVFVRGRVVVRNDAAGTAANILAREAWYRAGLAADLIMLSAYIAVTFLFYSLFKRVDAGLSLLAAFFSLIGIAVLAVNCVFHLAPLVLLGGASYLAALEMAERQALALLSLGLHARVYSVSGVFFGLYCILIGRLVFRSRFLPRLVGAFMVIGGLSYLTSSFAAVAVPKVAARLPDPTVLGGMAELALTLWLILRGVNVARWRESSRSENVA